MLALLFFTFNCQSYLRNMKKYFEKGNLSIYTTGTCQLYRDLKSANLQKVFSRGKWKILDYVRGYIA